MEIVLSGARCLDSAPWRDAGELDGAFDIRIKDGRIAEIGKGLKEPSGGRKIDVSGHLLTAGLVDLHVHFREPGHEYKEDIESGSKSAAAGGFTTVCAMPNTKPVNDCRAVTELMVRRSKDVGLCRVLPVGAISKGLLGESLAEYGEMKEAGIVAVSDDGRPVMDAGLMRRALEYARTFGLPVIQHAEDLSLAQDGVMNEGAVSTRLGLRGQPPAAESVMVARDVDLCEWTGGQYHVAHISAARSVELVRQAKKRGLPVTCEVTPHHVALTDDSVSGYDTVFKVSPPLRENSDRQAMLDGLADGTIDCIATDHAPHSGVEKDIEFDCAACGMLGLETAFGIGYGLVQESVIDLKKLVSLLTWKPAQIFALDKQGIGSLQVGGPADIALFNLEKSWTVDREHTISKSKNTPFHGHTLHSKPVLTLFGGKVSHDPQGWLS